MEPSFVCFFFICYLLRILFSFFCAAVSSSHSHICRFISLLFFVSYSSLRSFLCFTTFISIQIFVSIASPISFQKLHIFANAFLFNVFSIEMKRRSRDKMFDAYLSISHTHTIFRLHCIHTHKAYLQNKPSQKPIINSINLFYPNVNYTN